MEGFRNIGMHNVVDYIIENYVLPDDLCMDGGIESSIQMRIDQSKNIVKGKIIPNIILPNLKGKIEELYNITSKDKLILFYSIRCPHCEELLPNLLEFYNENKKEFEIFAISIDEDRNDWHKYLSKNNFPWINVSDLKGWKSKTTYEYYIYATPTMFLVDKTNRLLAKPKSINELVDFFNKKELN